MLAPRLSGAGAFRAKARPLAFSRGTPTLLADAPVEAGLAVEELVVDQRPPQLGVIRPDLPQDGDQLGFRDPLARRQEPDHLLEDEPALLLAGGPAHDPPLPPEGPDQAADLTRGQVPSHRTRF